ncbi:hemerythrin domain-containing protein [Stakelama saccharophila]|uniref:Hemerythrin domain-containing protein n=1 Tax=Stakelama saccharophila TaxID=3075605 RepID=A0ABZ0B8T9_9SPHN|nr:hemerythrin domain-containing protein [Stakelama sp. W311]WNO53804.1 hemerythrin domain-containing protein [Stakelama sp. W311]
MADARIFEDLKRDHDRHRDLLARIAETSGDGEERRTLFEKFRVDVSAHAAAEEESLYAAMLATPDLRDDARHSVSEHKEVDDYLGELADTDMSSSGWLTRFKEMRHRYEHHIDEEEEEMFPAAAEDLSQREEDRIAKLFEQRKPAETRRAEATESGDDRA